VKRLIVLLALVAFAGMYASAGIGVTCFSEGAQPRYWNTQYRINCTTNLSASAVDFGGLAMSNWSGGQTKWSINARFNQTTNRNTRSLCGKNNITVTATPATTTSNDQVWYIKNLTVVPCVAADDPDYTVTILSNDEFELATNLSVVKLTSIPNMTFIKGSISSSTAAYQDIVIKDDTMGSIQVSVPQIPYNATDMNAPYVGVETADKLINVKPRINETAPNQILPAGTVGDAVFYVLGSAVIGGTAYALLRRRPVKKA
jgi:hypothetical protein